MQNRFLLALLLMLCGAVPRAAAQAITLSDSTYNFETVAQDVPVTRFPYGISLLNTGSAPLLISGISVNPPDFFEFDTCPNSLAPGTGCFLELNFAPSGIGLVPGTLTIATNVGSQVIGLVGQGVMGSGPVGNLQNTSVKFGTWGLGSTNPFGSQAVFQNLGSVPLAIDSITISPSDFSITANNCPTTVNPGDNCTVNFTMKALSLGNVTGALTFNTESIGSPQVVNLSYTGVSASGPVLSRPLALFDESLNGRPIVGTAIAPVQGYIVNSGSSPLLIQSIAVTPGFFVVNDCGTSLAPGASCLVLPSFAPTVFSSVGGSLTITSNDPLSPHVDALSGIGEMGEDGSPALSPEVLNFTVPAGMTSPAQTVTFSNAGAGDIGIFGVVVNSPDNGAFSQTNNCPSDLPAGNSCTINVTFSPATSGNFIGTVSVQDDLGGNGQQDVLLAGTSQICLITPAPSSLSFGAAGGSSSFQVNTTFPSCTWNAVSDAGFINIVSGASGTGPGTVSFNVAANADFSPRTGTITVGGQPVTITQAATPETLSVSTDFVVFSTSGSAPVPQSISVSSNGPPIAVQASAMSTGNWLSANPTSATTPASISLSVNPSNLAPGIYPGAVAISGSGVIPITVAVQLTVEPPLLVTTGVSGTLTLVQAGTSGTFSGSVPLLTNFTGTAFTASVTGPPGITVTPSSGTLPALLNVTIDAGNLSPAAYQGTLSASIPGATPSSVSIPIAFTVPAPQTDQLTVSASGLTLSLPKGVTHASGQVLVSNPGSNAINFQASADQPWIQVSPGNGTTNPLSAVPITVDLNLAGFAPGTYNANVILSASLPAAQARKDSAAAAPIVIPIHAVVSGEVTGVTLSETGLTFQAVAGGPPPPGQSFQVLSAGSNAASFQVSGSTVSGGSQWLSVSGGGRTDNSAAIRVSVNPSGLAVGTYYGLVQVNSQGTPQVLTVVLNVVAAGTSRLPAVVEPTGLIFVSAPGASDATDQTVSISNPNTNPIHYVSAAFFDNGSNWFSANPVSGQIAPGSTVDLTFGVTPFSLTGALPPGVYTGRLEIGFDDNTVQIVQVLLVVVQTNSAAGASTPRSAPRLAGCTPTKLLPVFSSLGQGFSVPAGWPQVVSVNIVDDCGDAMTTGSVTASFSDGDPPLSLTSLNTGIWTATWTVQSAAAQTTIVATAQMQTAAGKLLNGTASITGGGQANPNVPVVSPGAIVNAASFAKNATLAPGSIVTLFGSGLSQQPMSAASLPLPKQLGDLSVVIAGAQIPLLYANSGQVNAVLPFELTPNSTQQVLVIRGGAISTPQAITISTAEPAVFSANGSGGGQGIVFGVTPDGTQTLADAQHPVGVGEAVVIYANGLGGLNPPLLDGEAAPSSPLSKLTDTITVKIGGVSADVFYAGVVPGFAGLYQVNAYVPAGVPTGTAVPLIMTIDGQNNPPVTIAVQ